MNTIHVSSAAADALNGIVKNCCQPFGDGIVMKRVLVNIHIPEWFYLIIPKLAMVSGVLLLALGSLSESALGIMPGIISITYGLMIHIKRVHMRDPHRRAMHKLNKVRRIKK